MFILVTHKNTGNLEIGTLLDQYHNCTLLDTNTPLTWIVMTCSTLRLKLVVLGLTTLRSVDRRFEPKKVVLVTHKNAGNIEIGTLLGPIP